MDKLKCKRNRIHHLQMSWLTSFYPIALKLCSRNEKFSALGGKSLFVSPFVIGLATFNDFSEVTLSVKQFL